MNANYQFYCCIARPKYVISESDNIINIVSNHTNIPRHKLVGRGAADGVAEAKHIARYFIYHYTRLSLRQVSRKTGSINHTTTIRSLERLRDWMDTMPSFKQKVEKIEQIVQLSHKRQIKITKGFYE